jgi:hypothetical protein
MIRTRIFIEVVYMYPLGSRRREGKSGSVSSILPVRILMLRIRDPDPNFFYPGSRSQGRKDSQIRIRIKEF